LLERLVEQTVTELAARQADWLLEPWFRPRPVADAIRRLQSVSEMRKFSIFYEKHGCIRCKTKRRNHAGNGFCHNCRSWLQKNLKECLTQDCGEPDTDAATANLTSRIRNAKRLLGTGGQR